MESSTSPQEDKSQNEPESLEKSDSGKRIRFPFVVLRKFLRQELVLGISHH